jgi:hypothetical protein
MNLYEKVWESNEEVDKNEWIVDGELLIICLDKVYLFPSGELIGQLVPNEGGTYFFFFDELPLGGFDAPILLALGKVLTLLDREFDRDYSEYVGVKRKD